MSAELLDKQRQARLVARGGLLVNQAARGGTVQKLHGLGVFLQRFCLAGLGPDIFDGGAKVGAVGTVPIPLFGGGFHPLEIGFVTGQRAILSYYRSLSSGTNIQA